MPVAVVRHCCSCLVLAIGVCLTFLSNSPASASEGPHAVLRLCIANQPHPPFSDPQLETPTQQRIRQAAGSQGFTIEFVALPWRRCIHEAHKDLMDGAVGPGDRLATEKGLRLPLKDGAVDMRRALGFNRFVFFRRAGDTVDWDGQRFLQLSGPVLMIGSVGEIRLDLARTDVAIEDSANGPEQLARMLLARRGNLAVDSQGRLLEIMASPEFAGRLEMLDTPLGGRASLLAIAPHVYAQFPHRIEALWDEYARLREEQDPSPLH